MLNNHTSAQSLDSIADQVLVLARATPRRTHVDIASTLFLQHGIRVSPDNLRVWLHRRFSEQFRATVLPAVLSNLDIYMDLVNELRPLGYTWVQVMKCIKDIDPTLNCTPEGLRSWYSRRSARGQTLLAAKVKAVAGAASFSTSRINSDGCIDHVRTPDAAVKTTSVAPDQLDFKARATAALAKTKVSDPLGDALRFAKVPQSSP